MCLLLDYVQGNINIKMELNINTLKTILLEYSWFAMLCFNTFLIKGIGIITFIDCTILLFLEYVCTKSL